jgi:hypothetical protein
LPVRFSDTDLSPFTGSSDRHVTANLQLRITGGKWHLAQLGPVGRGAILPAMSRPVRPVALLLAAVFAAGCSGGDETAGTTTGAGTDTVAAPGTSKITLRAARTNTGPWTQSLSLEHGADGQPTGFFVCAAWDEVRAPAGCDAAPGAELPAGTILRLEQRPVGAAAASSDSPGWATVGTTDRAELRIPLSDFVSGLDVDTATYRVTLRPLAGGLALTTSDSITVAWSS